MSDSGFGSNSKRGTVYSGPTPVGTTGTIYGGPTPSAGGTVYNGPSAGGTVYGGPPTGGTVYNVRATSQAPAVGSSGAQSSLAYAKAAKIFFAIAIVSVVNIVLLFVGFRMAIGLSFIVVPGASLPAILGLNLLPAALFAGLGVMVSKESKAAFLIGAVLYAGDMVLLALNNPGLHPVSIVIHGVFLFTMFRIFREMPH